MALKGFIDVLKVSATNVCTMAVQTGALDATLKTEYQTFGSVTREWQNGIDATWLTASGSGDAEVTVDEVAAFSRPDNLKGLVVADRTGAQEPYTVNLSRYVSTNADTIAARRGLVTQWLKTEYDNANMLLWSFSDDTTRIGTGRWLGMRPRTANTIAWAEMIDRAAHVDSNLTDNAKWALIKAEIDLGVQNWYSVHDESSWNAVRNALLNVWYSTQANGTAATVSSPVISMTLTGGQTGHKFNDYLK